ncbi:MAG: methionine biosynthesis protein MetW [Acidobacteriota bacterium]
MKILLAILEEDGLPRSEVALSRLPAFFLDNPERLVIVRFAVPQANDSPFGDGRFQVERIVSMTPLGYGEQIKLAFEMGKRMGVYAVVTVDGGARYPLEDVGDLLAALDMGADLAVASPEESSLTLTGVGAWLATRLLNALARTRLSSWHPGYRAYRVAALSHIPYAKNVDDRGFNTEILLQMIIAGRAIARVPTRKYSYPTLPLVSKCRFAWGMFKAVALSLLHQCSLFYQPQFDMERDIETYSLKLGYRSSHSLALEAVPPGSRVLDIGCGNGALDHLLKERGCRVHGLDRHPDQVIAGLDAYTSIDLDVRTHAFPVRGFECILLLDIIEHLREPETLLCYLRAESGRQPKPLVVLSIPNVAFFIIRLRLLCGSFHYGKLGILDLTHTRLFTEKTIVALLTRNGYAIESISGIPAPFPKAIGLNVISRTLLVVNQWLIALSRGLFSYQLLIKARPKPILDDLITVMDSSSHA